MSERRPTNLRDVLSIAAVMVTLLAATAAISLILATSVMQSMTREMAASVESVRTIEEAEVTLLLHVRAVDRGEKREYAAQVQQLLDEASQYVTDTAEAMVLAEARRDVDNYLQLSRQPDAALTDVRALESRAVETLERLVDLAGCRRLRPRLAILAGCRAIARAKSAA